MGCLFQNVLPDAKTEESRLSCRFVLTAINIQKALLLLQAVKLETYLYIEKMMRAGTKETMETE